MEKKKISRLILGTMNNPQNNDRITFLISKDSLQKCQNLDQIILVNTDPHSAVHVWHPLKALKQNN